MRNCEHVTHREPDIILSFKNDSGDSDRHWTGDDQELPGGGRDGDPETWTTRETNIVQKKDPTNKGLKGKRETGFRRGAP